MSMASLFAVPTALPYPLDAGPSFSILIPRTPNRSQKVAAPQCMIDQYGRDTAESSSPPIGLIARGLGRRLMAWNI